MATKKKPTKTLAERSLMPLCIRFREKDLEAIRLAAAWAGEAATVWVREIILMRVRRKEEGIKDPPLKYEMDGLGRPFSIRFRPSDFRKVAHCAAREDRSATVWARAVVVEYANRPRLSRQERQDRAAAVGE